MAFTVNSSLLIAKGKSSGNWITILVLRTGDAEEGVSDTTFCAFYLKVRTISVSTETLLITIEGINVCPTS